MSQIRPIRGYFISFVEQDCFGHESGTESERDAGERRGLRP
jgi:hypothetical protein